jgi:hypothetical protein
VATPAEGELSFQLLLRSRLDRETDLLTQRTGWVVGSQAFLFSAYAIALNGRFAGATPTPDRRAHLLVEVIPWISIVSLVLLIVTLAGGFAALLQLRRHLAARGDRRVQILDASRPARTAGLIAPLLVPWAFLITWIVLLVTR